MKIFSNFISENDPIYDGLKALNKPITFFYDYIPQSKEQLQINPYNFIMLHEPNEFFGMHDWVNFNSSLFTGILTWNENILNQCENSILFPYSCNHLDIEYIESFKKSVKKFEVSFLSGAKKLVQGHQLRQEVYKIEKEITIPKKWFYVLDDFNWDDFNKGGVGRPQEAKAQTQGRKICFNESMFHICVENVKYNNWFTEKISDAFNTKTIPIYWGCPNISDFGYDERGIIRFETPKELLYIINNLTEEKYNEMKPFVDYNYETAKKELKFKEKLELFFHNLIEQNNL